jgi:hypothetical protein
MQEFVVPKSIPKIFPIELNVAVSSEAIRGPEYKKLYKNQKILYLYKNFSFALVFRKEAICLIFAYKSARCATMIGAKKFLMRN